MQSAKERRTPHYIFTSKRQLIDFYIQFMPKQELTGLIKKIESEPFTDRKDGNCRLDRIKNLEWNINRYLKEKMVPEYH